MGGGPDGRALGAAVFVVLLVAAALTAALAPPAFRAHAARKEAFLLSFGPRPTDPPPPPRPRRSPQVQCRRRIVRTLLVAMAVTFLVGLVPTFRPLLVVHLFLLDFFLAYVALLAHAANRAARRQAPEVRQGDVADTPEPAGTAIHRRPARRRALLPDLGPLTSAG